MDQEILDLYIEMWPGGLSEAELIIESGIPFIFRGLMLAEGYLTGKR